MSMKPSTRLFSTRCPSFSFLPLALSSILWLQILKDSKTGIWLKNIQLALYSMSIAFIQLYASGADLRLFFRGYTGSVRIVIVVVLCLLFLFLGSFLLIGASTLVDFVLLILRFLSSGCQTRRILICAFTLSTLHDPLSTDTDTRTQPLLQMRLADYLLLWWSSTPTTFSKDSVHPSPSSSAAS
jgi:hypothetical protein